MAINLSAPIDISAVMTAITKHKDLLKAVDKLDAFEVLQNFTPYPGVTDSIELGRVEGGSISSKYNGVFLGDKSLGKIVPRRLIVRPIVAEMSDEPERYRRTYITEVPGEQRAQHPFELWIIQHGIAIASEDLHNALFIAKYDSGSEKTSINDSFDSLGAIIEADKATKLISAENGNLYSTGEITRANVGQVLLKMFRSRPSTFRKKESIMIIADEIGDMYDDWLSDESVMLVKDDTAGQETLRGTKGKCKLVRVSCLPEDSQMVILTRKENVVYGFDKMSDLKGMKPFASGNPYKFTATMKYVFGMQFVSIHKSEFCVNDRPLYPTNPSTLGTVKVTITPTDAVTAGAKWRLSGEDDYHASGDVAAVKAGDVTIEYNSVPGYTAPVSAKVTVVATQQNDVKAVFTKN